AVLAGCRQSSLSRQCSLGSPPADEGPRRRDAHPLHAAVRAAAGVDMTHSGVASAERPPTWTALVRSRSIDQRREVCPESVHLQQAASTITNIPLGFRRGIG